MNKTKTVSTQLRVVLRWFICHNSMTLAAWVPIVLYMNYVMGLSLFKDSGVLEKVGFYLCMVHASEVHKYRDFIVAILKKDKAL